jgi:hypothetical protein
MAASPNFENACDGSALRVREFATGAGSSP